MSKSVKLTQMNDEKVVASKGPAHLNRAVLLGVAALLVLGAAGGGYYWYQKHNKAAVKPALSAAQENDDFKSVMAQATHLHASRKDQEAIDVLDAYRTHTPNKGYQAQAAMLEGTYLELQKKYAEALKQYQFAETVRGQDDLAVSSALGRAYTQTGDKQEAIKHYKNCVRLIQGTDRGTFEDVDMYNAYIKQLGG
jgi:tetratricopeptide (TPR) repeat protein